MERVLRSNSLSHNFSDDDAQNNVLNDSTEQKDIERMMDDKTDLFSKINSNFMSEREILQQLRVQQEPESEAK